MKTQWKHVFLYVMSAMFLMGCSTLAQQKAELSQRNADNLKAWDDANTKFIVCNKGWQAERRKLSPQFGDVVTSSEDPRYFQSLTSRALVSQEFKDALVKFRPQQIACRKELFANLGEKNIRVKLLYRDAFQVLDAGVVDILDGRIKTMGEVNRAYVKWVDDANDARMLLRAAMENLLD